MSHYTRPNNELNNSLNPNIDKNKIINDQQNINRNNNYNYQSNSNVINNNNSAYVENNGNYSHAPPFQANVHSNNLANNFQSPSTNYQYQSIPPKDNYQQYPPPTSTASTYQNNYPIVPPPIYSGANINTLNQSVSTHQPPPFPSPIENNYHQVASSDRFNQIGPPPVYPNTINTAVPPPPVNNNAIAHEGVQPDSSFYSQTSFGSLGNIQDYPQTNRQYQNTSSKKSSRIDPSQMPRPEPPLTGLVFHTNSGTTTGSGRKIPPSTNSNFKAIDTGNCSPRLIRCTTAAPPGNKEVLNMTAIPLSLIATPFASPENGEENPHLVNLGEAPPRCSRCKGYVCPQTLWTNQGNSWICSLCGMSNQTPKWYMSTLDSAGLRTDRLLRPELCHGAVDFVVGSDFCVRSLQQQIFGFAIDISKDAVDSGFTNAAILATIKALKVLHERTVGEVKVGVFTFCDNIHFFDIRAKSDDPIRAIVCNAEDPIGALPFNKSFLSLSHYYNDMELLLDRLPSLISSLNSSYSKPSDINPGSLVCPMAIISSLQHVLGSHGGHLTILSSHSSNIGYGVIKPRDFESLYGTNEEFLLYTGAGSLSKHTGAVNASNLASIASNVGLGAKSSDVSVKKGAVEAHVVNQYLSLTDSCLKSNVSVNAFVYFDPTARGENYSDLSLFGELCYSTGGSLLTVTGSSLHPDFTIRLTQLLNDSVLDIAVSECMMKLRCSQGYSCEKVIGHGVYDNITGELEIPLLTKLTTFCFDIKLDSAVKEDEKVHFQLAVLYTSLQNNQRRVRVLNLTYHASLNATLVFRHADLDATISAIVKHAADKALTSSLNSQDNYKSYLTDLATDILYKYRVNCSPESARGQLILPESLKLVPLYSLAALKHPAFLENSHTSRATSGSPAVGPVGPYVRGSERSIELRRLLMIDAKNVVNSLYPRLYAVHNFEEGEGELVGEDNTTIKMPRTLANTSEIFESEGMYLMDDGSYIWLYISRGVSEEQLDDWFSCLDGIPFIQRRDKPRPSHMELKIDTDEHVNRINKIIEHIRDNSHTKPELRIVWGGEIATFNSQRFSLRLVEDSIYGNLSYVDYLCKVHSKILSKK